MDFIRFLEGRDGGGLFLNCLGGALVGFCLSEVYLFAGWSSSRWTPLIVVLCVWLVVYTSRHGQRNADSCDSFLTYLSGVLIGFGLSEVVLVLTAGSQMRLAIPLLLVCVFFAVYRCRREQGDGGVR